MNFRSQPHLPVEKEKPGTVPRPVRVPVFRNLTKAHKRKRYNHKDSIEEYIKNPRPDGNIYDYYICDRGNHCIFKITPDGNVSLFAGRGSVSSDNKVSGNIDGELKTEARFDNPCGIAYDEETQTFYIADRENHSIRTISIE